MPRLHDFMFWVPGERDRWLRWRRAIVSHETGAGYQVAGDRALVLWAWEHSWSEQKHITYYRWKGGLLPWTAAWSPWNMRRIRTRGNRIYRPRQLAKLGRLHEGS